MLSTVDSTVRHEDAAVFLGQLFGHLPHGFLSLTAFRAGRAVSRSFPLPDGITTAAEWALKQDADPTVSGVYYRTTSLAASPKSGRGGAADAQHLTHLWADGDFGSVGHKGTALPADEAAVRAIVNAAGLPEPTLWVHTGGGLNPVWTLSVPVSAQEGAAYALGVQDALKAAAAPQGVHWDNVGDLARIMRLPGTHNRKADTPRPARIEPGCGTAYPLTAFPQAAAAVPPPAKRTAAPRADDNRADAFDSPTGPLDEWAALTSWAEILKPHGWTHVGDVGGTAPCEQWLRPGDPSSHHSLNAFEHNAVCHSDSAGLPSGPGQRLTKARVYCHLNGVTESELAREFLGKAPAVPVDVDPQTGEIPEDVADSEPAATYGEYETGANGYIPLSFYAGRPALRSILTAAEADDVSPDAVLHTVLARIAASTLPTVKVDSNFRAPATLNWFAALLGESGAGKGVTESTSDALAPLPYMAAKRADGTVGDLVRIHPSTGQGLVAMYQRLETQQEADGSKNKVVVQDKRRGYAATSEGDILVKAADSKSGETLTGTLCAAWVSEDLGQSNADLERRRELRKGSYTLSMSVAVQSAPAIELLSKGSIGLPQRFAWCHVVPKDDAEELRRWDRAPLVVGAFQNEVTEFAAGLNDVTLTLPAEAGLEIFRIAQRVRRNQGDAPLEAHQPLWRAKLSALLALLDGRTEPTMDDWYRSGVMWEASRQVVRGLQQRQARKDAEAREVADQRAARLAARSAVAASVAQAELAGQAHPAVVTAASRIHNRIVRLGGSATARDINRAVLNKKLRDSYAESGNDDSLWAASLSYATDQGWVVADGQTLTLGSVDPTA